MGNVDVGRKSPAMLAWCGVERNLRSALRRNYLSPFLQELEVRRFCADKSCPEYFECDKFSCLASLRNLTCNDSLPQEKLVSFVEGDVQDLVLAVGSAYDRLLVHGSSQVLEITRSQFFCPANRILSISAPIFPVLKPLKCDIGTV